MKKIFFQLYHIFKESKEILRQYGSEILKKKKVKKLGKGYLILKD
jgi:hypothetical protein